MFASKMFCDFGVKTCNKFLSNETFKELSTKHDRIHFILQRFNLDRLIEVAVAKLLEYSAKARKSSIAAEYHLRCAQTLYLAQMVKARDHLKQAVSHASKAILNAQYGEQLFVSAFQLRSKCLLKLGEYENALLDIEVTGKYGKFSLDRVLIKAICLFSLNRFKPLKDYLREFNTAELQAYDDSSLLSELDLAHLTFTYLVAFLADPNFANRTSKSSELSHNPNVLHCMESLIQFEANYVLDDRCKIRTDENKGRHFVAEESIPKGATFLVERCFSLALDAQSQFERCLYCHKSCISFIPCKHCTEAIFCSEECFQYAWDRFHKSECTLLRLFRDSNNVSTHMYRTLIGVGLKQAMAIDDELHADCQEHLELEENEDSATDELSKEKLQSALHTVYDSVISDFMADKALRTTPFHKQSDDERIRMYRMNQALIDHNDMFEDYYDVCYMGTSMDVALMLFIYEHLVKNGPEDQQPSSLIWDQLRTVEFKPFTGVDDEDPFLSLTVRDFIQLVAIVQLNIRKLVTNVFSWNIYNDDYRVRKTVATCQCLVGSLINHSCNPNVEWDFRNGCIIYTATRDIAAGEEINNSYGPHKSIKFSERQSLLSANYYFNCRCDLCQKQVIFHPYVLGCLSCGGPVVCQHEIVVHASCMNCLAPYSSIHHRMKKVNQTCIKFKTLLHFFVDQPSSNESEIDDQHACYFNELIEMMNYQISYCYHKSVHFQSNLQAFCRLLHRLGKLEQACFFGQYQLENLDDVFDTGDKIKTSLAKVENSAFWFRLYDSYLRQFGDCSKANNKDSNKLSKIAQNLLASHFTSIQANALKLARQCEKQNVNGPKTATSDVSSDIAELTIQDLLDATKSPSMEDGDTAADRLKKPISVSNLMMDMLHLLSLQYCEQKQAISNY